MDEQTKLRSEGEQLFTSLRELERDQRVKEISGWSTGFADLDRCLDGIRPGLYLLVGAPGCGKTAFARQLLDQVVAANSVAGVYFTFAESVHELRVRTLARLTEVESRALRRGSSYLLHWYGVPRLQSEELSQLPASWEKVKRGAQEAKSWLDRLYLIECDRNSELTGIERYICEVKKAQQSDEIVAVVDDCERLAPYAPWLERINRVVEALQALAVEINAPIFAVSTAAASDASLPNLSEKIVGADAILALETDPGRAPAMVETVEAMMLYIVKNRSGERSKLAVDFAPTFARFAAGRVS